MKRLQGMVGRVFSRTALQKEDSSLILDSLDLKLERFKAEYPGNVYQSVIPREFDTSGRRVATLYYARLEYAGGDTTFEWFSDAASAAIFTQKVKMNPHANVKSLIGPFPIPKGKDGYCR